MAKVEPYKITLALRSTAATQLPCNSRETENYFGDDLIEFIPQWRLVVDSSTFGFTTLMGVPAA
jgi:hypothetical protein